MVCLLYKLLCQVYRLLTEMNKNKSVCNMSLSENHAKMHCGLIQQDTDLSGMNKLSREVNIKII